MIRWDAVEALAIRFHESHGAIVEALDGDTAFLNQTMMEAAEGEQVCCFRLSPVGPVMDVVGIDVFDVRAAGETATFVPGLESPLEGGRDGTGLAADVQWFAVFVFDERTRLASQVMRLTVSAAMEGPSSISQQPASLCWRGSAATWMTT